METTAQLTGRLEEGKPKAARGYNYYLPDNYIQIYADTYICWYVLSVHYHTLYMYIMHILYTYICLCQYMAT